MASSAACSAAAPPRSEPTAARKSSRRDTEEARGNLPRASSVSAGKYPTRRSLQQLGVATGGLHLFHQGLELLGAVAGTDEYGVRQIHDHEVVHAEREHRAVGAEHKVTLALE